MSLVELFGKKHEPSAYSCPICHAEPQMVTKQIDRYEGDGYVRTNWYHRYACPKGHISGSYNRDPGIAFSNYVNILVVSNKKIKVMGSTDADSVAKKVHGDEAE